MTQRTNMDRANEALKLCATMQELTGVDKNETTLYEEDR
jgi:hypothetical protein